MNILIKKIFIAGKRKEKGIEKAYEINKNL